MLLRELVIGTSLYGRDKDPDPELDPDPNAEGQEPDPAGQEPPVGEDEGKPFDMAAAAKLRKENQTLRAAKKAAETELAEIRRGQMSDLEKAQTERDEAQAGQVTAEAKFLKLAITGAIEAKATTAGFANPTDAVAFIDFAEVTVNEGKVDGRSVKALVDAVAKERPHLLKSEGSGSGDGGGTKPPVDLTPSERVKKYQDELLKGGGMVEIPHM